MPSPVTKQAQLWRGGFGDAYTERNAVGEAKLAALTAHWATILRSTIGTPPRSILEVGANIGLNLRALARLTNADLYAVEPNARARETLLGDSVVPPGHALDGLCEAIPLADRSMELAFTSGVLIHIHPDNLLAACREIHRVSSRYIVCVEYFAAKPEEVRYRGQSEALFKRDFGSFYLDNFPDLSILDCGFSWKRTTGLDDLTWWVFSKSS